MQALGYELDTRMVSRFSAAERRNMAGKVWRISPQVRAELLSELFADPEVAAIFDVTGGDLANETLDLIDWGAVAANPKPFAGYSDVSLLVNAIWQVTGQRTVLWNPRTLAERPGGGTDDVEKILAGERIFPLLSGDDPLPDPQTPIVGGNVRCLAKLAGTRYWPESAGKLVILEALGPGLEASASYMCAMRQLGLFRNAVGLILGQFTAIDAARERAELLRVAGEMSGLPVWQAPEVGHSRTAAPVTIG